MRRLVALCLYLNFVIGIEVPTGADNVAASLEPHLEPFLGRSSSTRREVRTAVQSTLQSEYRADTAERLRTLQDEMRSTYASLPKTEFGLLGRAAVRYLLHRHFVRSRAWMVTGLAPTGQHTWASLPSPLEVLRDRTHGSVHELFERRLQKRGLDLHEVAMLAAMVENQVHGEAVRRLHKAWKVLTSTEEATAMVSSSAVDAVRLAIADAEEVLDMYMASLVLSTDEYFNRKKFAIVNVSLKARFPIWNTSQPFVRQRLHAIAAGASNVSFSALENVVVDISEYFGRFQAPDCDFIKDKLMAVESQTPGQVSMAEFYKLNVEGGMFQFAEATRYLRHLGALNEQPGSMPHIFIANYVDSPSQRVASNGQYAVTCIDECEAFLAGLEERVAGPLASPAVVADFLANASSRTTPARGEEGLPDALLRHLESIAEVHGGAVPIHGRLLAQLLHHAFPRECPFPISGDAHYLLMPKDYGRVIHDKLDGMASRKEMLEFVNAPSAAAPSKLAIPWDPTEELVAIVVPLRLPFVSNFLATSFQAAACCTFLVLLISNLSMTQGTKLASSQRLVRLLRLC
eukprot:TRINITY_DN1033_c0_g2_i1.p1 TRINITY_DN1033_c0_g2~~TRINITY_DN1033_c0_g2_i1.p1  ORF type:complete len:590 (+),score=108.83 TRINITY_DN1033_c0_g2_i1:52-1770(+)